MSARAKVIIAAVAVAVVVGAAGLYWFEPWRLFTNRTVNEALPTFTAVATPTDEPTTDSPTTDPPVTVTGTPAPQNVLLATGTIISHEHASSGSAHLIRLADGRVQLALENLATSDGPDLHVWLTDQPVIEGTAGWHVFDDGRYVELGELKANNGNQIYDVPAGTDLSGLISVTIWCKRFAVSFGAAQLDAA